MANKIKETAELTARFSNTFNEARTVPQEDVSVESTAEVKKKKKPTEKHYKKESEIKVTYCFSGDPLLKDFLKTESEKEGISISNLINKILKEHYKIK